MEGLKYHLLLVCGILLTTKVFLNDALPTSDELDTGMDQLDVGHFGSEPPDEDYDPLESRDQVVPPDLGPLRDEDPFHRTKRATTCKTTADIGIIMDASGSVSSANFKTMKTFVTKLTQKFTVGASQTHFGIIRYSVAAHMQFKLDDKNYWTATALEKKINGIIYTSGGDTRTDLALTMARDSLFCATCGTRKTVPKMLLVITDGQSSRGPVALNVLRDQLKKLGVTVISIGVGSGINLKELKLIASEDKFVFQITNFSKMLQQLEALVKLACIKRCQPNPCQNGGSCKDVGNKYVCTCKAGYTGANCQTNKDECKPNPCQNGGKCTDLINDFTCTCKPGYIGKKCQTNKDECKPKPCQNGGSCKDLINDFKCSCKPGYIGKQCQTNKDECKPKPCQNGGKCTDLINDFKCTCVPGYIGKQCQTNKDECKPKPCQNGGNCTDLINDFKCTCVPGYIGKQCQINKDECKPKPCQNGGNCTDLINDFNCTCSSRRYHGKSCQLDKCAGVEKLQPRDNFIISHERQSYNGAIKKCTSLGGHLATIRNDAENKMLRRMLLQKGIASAYIGLHYSQTQKEYIWASGSLVCYTNWRSMNPNKLCATAYHAYTTRWADVRHHKKMFYICQK